LAKKVPFSEKYPHYFLPTFTLQKWAEPGQMGKNRTTKCSFFKTKVGRKWAMARKSGQKPVFKNQKWAENSGTTK
jgi:hypothetical protein